MNAYYSAQLFVEVKSLLFYIFQCSPKQLTRLSLMRILAEIGTCIWTTPLILQNIRNILHLLLLACTYSHSLHLREFSRLFFSFFSIFPSIFASSFFLYVTWLFNLFLSSSVILRLFVILIKVNGLCLNITSLMNYEYLWGASND